MYLTEINLTSIMDLTKTDRKYKVINRLPIMKRDISLVVSDTLESVNIEKIILDSSKEIVGLSLIDEYRGSQIDDDKKSLSYSIVFQNALKTLTEEEINKEMEKILKSLEEKLNISLRK